MQYITCAAYLRYNNKKERDRERQRGERERERERERENRERENREKAQIMFGTSLTDLKMHSVTLFINKTYIVNTKLNPVSVFAR